MNSVDIAYHFPPELMSLLVDTIPKLVRSKPDVLSFFRGAGVPVDMLADLTDRVVKDRANITKYEISRAVIERLNQRGESALGERRSVLQRVVDFENFEVCWQNDRLAAKGLVAEVRKLVNVKDSFTRMKEEREAERRQKQVGREAQIVAGRARARELTEIRDALAGLFAVRNPQERGKRLEAVLNRLFRAGGILVKESFSLQGTCGEGIVEQVDGVVEVDDHLYLVEMKWWNKPVDRGAVSEHLVRLHSRPASVGGIFISASAYTPAAVSECRAALRDRVIVLCSLEEVVRLLERQGDVEAFFRAKIRAAAIEKNPMYRAPE